MPLDWPHADRQWQPYRVLGVGLTGEHRLTAGVCSYRLGRVAATGRSHSGRLGRLHRLLDDGERLDGERVEVDLLAQAGGECFYGAGGVVAAAELPVDHVCTRGAVTRQWVQHTGEPPH